MKKDKSEDQEPKHYPDANTESQVNPYNPEGHGDTEEEETGEKPVKKDK